MVFCCFLQNCITRTSTMYYILLQYYSQRFNYIKHFSTFLFHLPTNAARHWYFTLGSGIISISPFIALKTVGVVNVTKPFTRLSRECGRCLYIQFFKVFFWNFVYCSKRAVIDVIKFNKILTYNFGWRARG